MTDLGLAQQAVAVAYWTGTLFGFLGATALLLPWRRVRCLGGVHNFDYHHDDHAQALGRECWDCGQPERLP